MTISMYIPILLLVILAIIVWQQFTKVRLMKRHYKAESKIASMFLGGRLSLDFAHEQERLHEIFNMLDAHYPSEYLGEEGGEMVVIYDLIEDVHVNAANLSEDETSKRVGRIHQRVSEVYQNL